MDVTAGKKAKEAAVRLIGRHPFAEGIAPRRMMKMGGEKGGSNRRRIKGSAGKGKKRIPKDGKVCIRRVFCAQRNFMKMKMDVTSGGEKIPSFFFFFFLQVVFNKKLFDRREVGDF